MTVRFVDLRWQHNKIDLAGALEKAVSDSAFILGEPVKEFEEEFAAFVDTKGAVGVGNGTSALELSLRAHNIGPRDEVITVPNTFIATAGAIDITGATPVFVDIDESTYNINPDLIESKITDKTKAILPVHLFGQPADMEPILEIAKAHNLVVIEDACQAHGALYKGKRVGSLGNAAAFSFYPSKNLGALGDGGIVTSNDPQVLDYVRGVRTYFEGPKNEHRARPNLNSRLDALQAAFLSLKLPNLDEWNFMRGEAATLYTTLLSGIDEITTPTILPKTNPVWHLYVIRTKDRDALRADLDKKGIQTGIHYPTIIHHQKAYLSDSNCPIAERVSSEILSLPIFPGIRSEEIEYVAKTIRDHYAKE